jgi:hypothetical protein
MSSLFLSPALSRCETTPRVICTVIMVDDVYFFELTFRIPLTAQLGLICG